MFDFGLPSWFNSKESACNAGVTGDVDSIPGLGRSLRGGHGNPLQYSCLENPIDRGARWATVHVQFGSVTQSCPTLMTLWTIACQAPLPKGFSRQEYWSGLPWPPPGYLPDPGIEPTSHVSCIGRQVLYHKH